MEKKLKAQVKLQIVAGRATPAPPVGPALAPHGINLKEFCDRFNELTKDQGDFKIPVIVKIYEDKTFDLQIKKPPASELIKKEAGIEKGSSEGKKRKVGKLTKEQIRKIAQEKLPDLNTTDINKAMEIIKAQAKNMGVEIIE